LKFLRPRQVVELSPVDAERLGIHDGDRVEVGSNGTRVRGFVKLRASVPGGSVFLVEGTEEDPANLLSDSVVEVRRVGGPIAGEPSAAGVVSTPAGEGHGEMPQSAPLPLPPVQPPSQTEEGTP
jgi:NADH-quinone oxidoreductase subunit G